MTAASRRLRLTLVALWTLTAPTTKAQSAVPTAMASAERRGGYFPAQLTAFNRDGTIQSTVGRPDDYGEPALSPDGARVAATVRGLISIYNLRDGGRTEVPTIPQALPRHLAWSPDGKRIAFVGNESGRLGVYSATTDGSGGLERIYQAEPGEPMFLSDWSDERFLLFQSRGKILMLVVGQGKTVQLVQGPYVANHGKLSPDRRYLAYWSNESGQGEIFVRRFDPSLPGLPPTSGKWKVSGPGAGSPLAWGRDGRELYYRASRVVMAVEFDPAAPVPTKAPQNLFRPVGLILAGGSISRDGTLFLFNVRVPPERKVVALDTPTLQKYVGRYAMSNGSELVVSMENGQLQIQRVSSAGEIRQLLLPEGQHRFFVRSADQDHDYEFQTDDQDNIVHVIASFGAIRETGWRK